MLSKLINKIITIFSNITAIFIFILAGIGAFFLFLFHNKKNNNKIQINFAELEAKEKARKKHEQVKKDGGNSIDNDIADMVE